LGVNAHHFAFQIEQWPAGVAGVDCRISLDERYVTFLRERAPLGADDACRDTVFEAEGGAYRCHPLACLELLRIADGHFGQSARFNLEQRNVCATVGAYHFGLELLFVGEAHGDFIGAFHHMGVGQDIAICADDEARAQRSGFMFARLFLLRLEASEIIEKSIIFGKTGNLLQN